MKQAERSRRSRSMIRMHAFTEFAEHGYAGSGINQICTRGNIPEPPMPMKWMCFLSFKKSLLMCVMVFLPPFPKNELDILGFFYYIASHVKNKPPKRKKNPQKFPIPRIFLDQTSRIAIPI